MLGCRGLPQKLAACMVGVSGQRSLGCWGAVMRSAWRTICVVGGLAVASAVLTAPPRPVEDSVAAAATECVVSPTLVNPCRPWLGAVAGKYPGSATWRGQIEAHEQRIGRQVDSVHTYHPAGQVTLTAEERYFVQRGTIVHLHWKPANRWVDAGGGNATVNAQIDQLADQIKSVSPHKVMLGVFGEPERFVTPGTSSCPDLRGDAGSPGQYRSMWANVQNRFAARGATNVVWVMNYLGYNRWDCLFPELWPGNDRVDWIVWDPYIGPSDRWDTFVGYFYSALERRSDTTHAFTSKPWGLAEFGFWYGTNQADAYRMYDDALASLRAERFPRLKLYEPFDTIGVVDTRISYTHTGMFDPVEQQHYNAFANDPTFSDPVSPPSPDITDHLSGCDKGVETGLSCFAGTYNAAMLPTWQTLDGHGGTHSVQVTNTTGAAATLGLNAKPTPVTSSQLGRVYTGSAWVKASQTGLPLTLLVRERRPADGSAPANGYTSVTWTATDTQWHPLTATYRAKEGGNGITLSIYAPAMPAAAWLRADDFSFTSTNP